MARIVITHADWKTAYKTIGVKNDNYIAWVREIAQKDQNKIFGDNTSYHCGVGVEYLYIPNHDDLQVLLNKFDYAYLAHAADVLAQHESTQENVEDLEQALIDAKLASEIEQYQGDKNE